MNLGSNTVLVTGGGSGIGFALAERFADAGSEVIVCGRRADQLAEAKRRSPRFHTRVCDVAHESDRLSLVDWATREFPNLNVLVNNAGIQNRMQVTENGVWERARHELAINLEAVLHLSIVLVPHLGRRSQSTIVNITSGLAFTPLALAPIYCATKAALHSFTLSLREQLAETSIDVIEIIPPAVKTDLGGQGLHTFGVPLKEFADAVMQRVEAGDREIAYGFAAESSRASRERLDEIFMRMNPRRRT